MTTDVAVMDQPHAEWRGSHDGIVWGPWQPLRSLDERLPHHAFIQVRIWSAGEWIASPIEVWD